MTHQWLSGSLHRMKRYSTSSDKATVAFTVRTRKEDYDLLQTAAGLQNSSLNALVNDAISNYLQSDPSMKDVQRLRDEYQETIARLSGGSS